MNTTGNDIDETPIPSESDNRLQIVSAHPIHLSTESILKATRSSTEYAGYEPTQEQKANKQEQKQTQKERELKPLTPPEEQPNIKNPNETNIEEDVEDPEVENEAGSRTAW